MERRSFSCSCLLPFLFLLLAGVAAVLLWVAFPILFPGSETPEPARWPESLEMIGREEWAGPVEADEGELEPMNGVGKITIHHDGLPEFPPLPMRTRDEIRKRIVAIRRSHSDRYADIGYHFVVDPLGRIWEGRPLEYQGAHVRGKNDHNIGILVLGNFFHDKPTQPGLNGLYSLIIHLLEKHQLDPNVVFTHGELAATGCPGEALQAEIDRARETGRFTPVGGSRDRLEMVRKLLVEIWRRGRELWDEHSGKIGL